MDTNGNFEQPSMVLNAQVQGYLRQAGKWAVFLGILGFIGSALVLILALLIGSFFSFMVAKTPELSALPASFGGIMSFVYVLIAVVYFFFSLYLYQFGSRIKRGILYSDEAAVTNALGKLKSFFKLWGITTIVILVLYVLVVIVTVVIGAGMATYFSK
jgi:hypothetical protein